METVSLPVLSSKALPDDCVMYSLFFGHNVLSRLEQRKVLQEVRQVAEQLTNSFLSDYLWQREGFNLELVELDGHDYLCGETNFGDSIEDEWVVTFILRELSFNFPILWVKLQDTDGEFLLIEAAKALPRWLNPDVAENRVWINQGRLLIIPPDTSDELDSRPSKLALGQALERLGMSPSELLHLPELEDEAFRRLRKYPQELAKNNHRTLIFVPRNLAYILHHRPAYISSAADAFYVRDPISMRCLHSSCSAKLAFAPADLVEMCVKFTRVGFAQLKTQHFPMPHEWARLLIDDVTATNAVRLELGMKVTYGFEMLITDPRNRDVPAVHDISQLIRYIQDNIECLPSNQELNCWEQTEDDDSWLDIDYVDFERGLDGVSPSHSTKTTSNPTNSTQDNLRELVSRLKSFVNNDNSSESDGGSSLKSEDDSLVVESNMVNQAEEAALEESMDIVEFSEAKFSDMIQWLSSNSSDSRSKQSLNTDTTNDPDLINNTRTGIRDDNENIQMLSRAMETELLKLGALQNTESENSKTASLASITELDNSEHNIVQRVSDETEDLDYNLAKNVLESFKSQAGLAGPGGNLMGLMGVRFPRDDGGSGRANGFTDSNARNTSGEHDE